MGKLILLRGLPGSGKSTKAKAEFPGYFHLEADMFFLRNVEGQGWIYVFDPTCLRAAHEWCQKQVRQQLVNGYDVVVSNTFTQRWEAQPYLDMAAELGVEVQVITCTGNYQNIHGVPEAALTRMRERWEEF